MDYKKFVDEKIKEIRDEVKDEKTICALSGGVDSSVVAVLAHKAEVNIGNYFIDDFFRQKDEYKFVKDTFSKLDIDVKLCDIQDEMLEELEWLTNNKKKRPLFRNIFYNAFKQLVQINGAKYLFQGTIKADEKMFEKGQLQHNVGVAFSDYGIEKVVEPLSELYKYEVREVARILGLPKEISERSPFPGPGLLIRCFGKVTREKVELIRNGLVIAQEELKDYNPFQVVVAISDDLVCSMRERAIPDKYMLIVRAVKSKDAMTAQGIIPSQKTKDDLENRLINLSNKVGRVLWDPTNKPLGTIEYI